MRHPVIFRIGRRARYTRPLYSSDPVARLRRSRLRPVATHLWCRAVFATEGPRRRTRFRRAP